MMRISRRLPVRRAACSIFIRIPVRRRCGLLLEAFGKLTLEHGDAMRILDKTGTLRMAHEGNGQRPEIDRGALRNLLLSSLPPGLVRWNARVTGVSREESGFNLSFADGSVATAGILIGADGAW